MSDDTLCLGCCPEAGSWLGVQVHRGLSDSLSLPGGVALPREPGRETAGHGNMV